MTKREKFETIYGGPGETYEREIWCERFAVFSLGWDAALANALNPCDTCALRAMALVNLPPPPASNE